MVVVTTNRRIKKITLNLHKHLKYILSIYRNKKICGYDFYEAYAGEDGLPRLDLNGSHSSVIFEEGIEERLSVLPNDQPLFAYMSLKAPHGPLQPKEHILNMYRDQYGLDPGKKFEKSFGSDTGQVQEFQLPEI